MRQDAAEIRAAAAGKLVRMGQAKAAKKFLR
jgi:hypothetical protein